MAPALTLTHSSVTVTASMAALRLPVCPTMSAGQSSQQPAQQQPSGRQPRTASMFCSQPQPRASC